MSKNKKTVFCESEEITIEDNPFGYFKDGLLYCKTNNGEVMKIGGSGCGKTRYFPRYFRKPDLMPTNLRGENNETS